MKHIRYASIVLFIHGAIETFSSLMSFAPSDKIKNHIFALPFLKENLITVGAVGAIFGILHNRRDRVETRALVELVPGRCYVCYHARFNDFYGAVRNRRRYSDGVGSCIAAYRPLWTAYAFRLKTGKHETNNRKRVKLPSNVSFGK